MHQYRRSLRTMLIIMMVVRSLEKRYQLKLQLQEDEEDEEDVEQLSARDATIQMNSHEWGQ